MNQEQKERLKKALEMKKERERDVKERIRLAELQLKIDEGRDTHKEWKEYTELEQKWRNPPGIAAVK